MNEYYLVKSRENERDFCYTDNPYDAICYILSRFIDVEDFKDDSDTTEMAKELFVDGHFYLDGYDAKVINDKEELDYYLNHYGCWSLGLLGCEEFDG